MTDRNRRRVRRSSLVLAGLLVAMCALLSAAAVIVYRLPEMAEDRFGPASPLLGRAQKIQYAFQLFLKEETLLAPLPERAEGAKFEIQLGEPVYSITARLQQEGWVPDGEAVRAFLIYSGLDTRVQAGEYRFEGALNSLELARGLEDPTPGDVRFIVLAGWRVEEIAAALPTSGLAITPEEFLAKAAQPGLEWLPEGWGEANSLEGLLAAGEYIFPRETTADQMISAMTERMESLISSEIRNGFDSQGLSLKEGVTLASIVQKEAVVEDEQARIASVFLNRWNAGMKLESDPTVQYAVGNSRLAHTWWVNPVLAEDLQTDSPYNTYIYAGLPPTPICAVSDKALRAVAFPETTPYYYFRAGCEGDGRHLFAETYEGHLQNACQ